MSAVMQGRLAGLRPEDIGMGGIVQEFRPIQLEAMEFAIYSPQRFVGLGLPTGAGKSIAALGIQAITGWRTVACTVTKGLMDQYLDSVKGTGYPLVDIRGRANYDCREKGMGDCETGRHKGCDFRMKSGDFTSLYNRNVESTAKVGRPVYMPSCTYDCRRMQALLSPLVITNYALWLLSRQGWGSVDCLILDEGHLGMEALAGVMSVRLGERELRDYLHVHSWEELPKPDELEKWAEWADEKGAELADDLKAYKLTVHTEAGLRKVRQAEKLQEKLDVMADIEEGEWIGELKIGGRYGRTWEFDAVWPGRDAEKRLFRKVEKVVLMSATLKQKALTDLWVKREDMAFKEWRRVFQRARCPIYYMPAKGELGAALRITKKSKDAELAAWVEHMDGLMDKRLDVRIVLLTTSYKYQEYIMEHSRHARYMVGNTQDPNSDTAMEMFEKFIVAPPPAILCSPSFGTGWDFKGDRCRFLIISKIPLKVPGSADKLMGARLKRDKDYGNNQTMQEVAQAIGRPQRGEEDWAEVVIADGSWGWFGHRNKHLAPIALVEDVRGVGVLPDSPFYKARNSA